MHMLVLNLRKLLETISPRRASSSFIIFPLSIGLAQKKRHCFDLGTSTPQILVECKSHRWTEGAKVPSGKLTVWYEAMFYFYLSPRNFRKIFFVLHDCRNGNGETLLGYYRRTYPHLIPEGVEFMEFDDSTGQVLEL